MAKRKRTPNAAKRGPRAGRGRWPRHPGESVGGYFRNLYQDNPQLLKAATNDEVLERWLVDHPGETDVPQRIKNILYNPGGWQKAYPTRDGGTTRQPAGAAAGCPPRRRPATGSAGGAD